MFDSDDIYPFEYDLEMEDDDFGDYYPDDDYDYDPSINYEYFDSLY